MPTIPKPKMNGNDGFISLKNLTFSYPAPFYSEPSENSVDPVFENLTVSVERGSVVLLTGLNGVGKSTLLSLLAGHHLLSEDPKQPSLMIDGKRPFHDFSSNQSIVLLNDEFPVTLDLKVQELLDQRNSWVDLKKEKELLALLQVDPKWRMHRVSEGQKRRVQLLLSLRKKIDLLLLDEVTTHLDLLVRADFLTWVKNQARKERLTVLYATHIIDGLWSPKGAWPSHLFFLGKKGEYFYQPFVAPPAGESLYTYIEALLRNGISGKGDL